LRTVLREIPVSRAAGYVVEHHVEARLEQVFPASAQKREKVLLVFEEQVVAAVERVLRRQPGVAVEQVRHGAAFEPLAVCRHSLPGESSR